MEPTASQLMAAVHSAQDNITDLRGEMPTADDIGNSVREAVRDGISAAVSDPAVWSAAIAAMHMRARSEAGGWLLGGIKSVISKVFWVLLIVSGVYAIGGWSALVALVKARG